MSKPYLGPKFPVIDLGRWRTTGTAERHAIATELDAGLRGSGFLMVSNHGISQESKDALRAAASRFFRLPAEVKAQYETNPGGRGWIPPGREGNAFVGLKPDATRPDLKESFRFGREFRTGDPTVDGRWFTPNVDPVEVPELAELCRDYAAAVRNIYLELLEISALALGLAADWFSTRALDSPHGLSITRYPPMSETGTPSPGQFRIGPHTDWGVFTILDRQEGHGGLQIQDVDGTWHDAPSAEQAGSFTVNIGDLMARWTGDRWRSTRHRVLPPSPEAPDEELVSLILFFVANVDIEVSPLPAPIGHHHYETVIAGEYLRERAQTSTVS